jgi:L-aspartate oxidase
MKKEIADFLIIGGGVAGLRAAIELAPHGGVIIVTKDIPTEGSTEYAQGGVAVALSDEDEVGIHFEDTIKAGDGLCREEAVRVLVEEGPERIRELIDWGAEFDREGTKLSFSIEAAHSRRRILHAHGDSTGRELERVLINKVKTFPSVRRIQFCTAIDLIISDNMCAGAYVLRKNDVLAICSRATVLATGGAGQIFARTTNPAVATGDGMAIAYRAGVMLEDMEFVQFHPTVLFAPSAPQFLLSEAMRGEGAILRNTRKELFMKDYHPDAELAPRDIVSRAIISQMVRTNSNHVYLDLTHLGKDFVKKRFPRIYSTCLQYNVNITKEPVPVSPAAHYMMGGVRTDRNGVTSIRGLYAAGEAACTGVHGANRLASNSLLEGLVYGARAGKAALDTPVSIEHLSKDGGNLRCLSSVPDHEEIRHALRKTMWEKAGIIRCGESLGQARAKLAQWESLLNKPFLTRRELELKNMLTVSIIITEAALARKGSVGAHYRSDYKKRGNVWKKHLIWQKKEKGLGYERTD